MNDKRKAIIILLAVAVIWLLVIVAYFVLNKKTDTNMGQGNITLQDHITPDDALGADLYDSGYVVIIDNNDILTGYDLISLKGHVYISELLTLFLEENGYPDIEYVVIDDDSVRKDGAYSIFLLNIPDTEKSVQVTFDNIAEEFEFTIK